ncbi:MAG: hypothetical protein LCI02_16770 [Proteobacteria bacterium]|nr:hypothetical protein [Pseudomonadota bacterium]
MHAVFTGRSAAGDGDGEPSATRLRELAREAFARWQALLADALRREGVPAARARRLAALTVAAIEGTVALCRAERSTRPLDEVRQELEAAIGGALGKP